MKAGFGDGGGGGGGGPALPGKGSWNPGAFQQKYELSIRAEWARSREVTEEVREVGTG